MIIDELKELIVTDLNKLFCTFSNKSDLNITIDHILDTYSILYNKIFVLESPGTDEYICTYNIDTFNTSNVPIIENTILMHRKKETSTIYSINSLNLLIRELNGGKLIHNYEIPWDNYRKCILLTRQGIFTKLPTEIFTIISVN